MARDKRLIQFYLTTNCNSRCKTCSIWRYKGEYMNLNPNVVADICAQNLDADFVLGGGEFTLYPYRHTLLDMLDDLGVNYTILSNAVNIRLLEGILDRHNVKNLTISCDGIYHDIIRGVKGNLLHIGYILDKYREKIPNIKLSYTYSKFNEDNFINDMNFIKYALGFDKVYFCIAQDMDLLKTNGDVEPSDLKNILAKSDMLYDKDRIFIENLLEGKKKKCDSVGSVFTVYTNGDVVTCQSLMSKLVIGNIYEKPFNDIVKNVVPFDCPFDGKCNLLCQRRYD